MELVMLDHCEFGSFGFFLIFRQHLPRDFSFQYEQIEWFFTTTITVCSSRKGTVVSRKGQQYNYKKGVSQVSGCPTSLLIEVLHTMAWITNFCPKFLSKNHWIFLFGTVCRRLIHHEMFLLQITKTYVKKFVAF